MVLVSGPETNIFGVFLKLFYNVVNSIEKEFVIFN